VVRQAAPLSPPFVNRPACGGNPFRGTKIVMSGENVIWESRTGTWSRGFFDVTTESPEPIYDYSAFRWVSGGHPSRDDAMLAGPETDPSDTFVLPYRGNSVQSRQYDRMALELRDPVAALAYRQYTNNKVARRGHQPVVCGARTEDGTPCQNLVAVRGRKCRWHR